jgi:hypothetical protein
MNFLQFAERIIKEENKPLAPNEIWEIGIQKGYDKQVNSTGKTPLKFFLKSIPQNFDINKIEKEQENNIAKKETGYSERDLHRYLSYYVYTYNNFVYTKTIFHETSSKKKYSQWLHPDIVGVYFTFEQWEPEIFEISKEIGNLAIKLFPMK